MITRKQFFKEVLTGVGRAAAQIWAGVQDGQSHEAQNDSIDPAFTELSPSLLAMEAERLGGSAGKACDDALRRRIYAQMAGRARQPGSDSTADE
jgi:hypothetical protein